jgi:uncharacterized protein YhjY with autotransporter beta-barrel domain
MSAEAIRGEKRRQSDKEHRHGAIRASCLRWAVWFACRSLATLTRMIAAPALVALALPQPAVSQTFDQTSFDALDEIIVNRVTACLPQPQGQPGCWITPGSPLDTLAFNLSQNQPTGVVSAVPAAVSPQAGPGMAIERRLQAVRESEERRRAAGPIRAIPAAYEDDTILAVDDQVQIPPAGAATPEIVISQTQGFSVFFNAGATSLNHHNNRYEDGYDAVLPTVTLGADYWFNTRLLAGAGFNYTNSDGNYDDGGGFNNDIFSPLLYATVLPFRNAFINTTLSYSRNENSNHRKVVIPFDPGAFTEPDTFRTSADYSENQFAATLQAGYDHPIDNFTVGPRLGFAFGHSQVDSFEEKGDSGLELRYSGLDQTSVQTSLGAAATVAIPIPNGVLLPQASASWVHEYANDARNIDARYVDAPGSPKFTFQREHPARNWANIGLGVSASLLNGMQPFAQFQTIQGNDNFVSYGGTAGLRFSF